MSEPEPPKTAEEAERRFIDDLVTRGEAVPEGTEPLPPNATHEIVEERDGVPTKVRRRRYSVTDDLGVPEPVPEAEPSLEPRRIRITVPSGAEFAEWRTVLRQHRVELIQEPTAEPPVVDAIATESAAERLTALGYHVEVLGPP